ncbi:LacI family DNA-binding transcriptional regulator [uncultured Sphaerochaeta sp.]|uniref:LacI family DNA-binding transcriptional regulator n=1 Tax=uncultured Sphaerochaeta sp. TaxID=886478 RepID=UPI002A0A39C9|nr:LacI family DNA-binding transcriptional regulator [uncultured Sphaerochaeta sp.]
MVKFIKMRATIKDVAKKAGVSIATVSNVLSGKKYVSSSLIEKVNDALKTLNYQKNFVASNFRAQKFHNIGVVVPDIANPFFGGVVRSIECILDEKNYQMILSNSNYDKIKEEMIIKDFISTGKIDGLILITPNYELVKKIESEIPIVVVDHTPFENENNIFFVYSDNIKNSSIIAQFTYEKGYRHFAYITGNNNINTSKIRLTGFRDQLKTYGVQEKDILVRRGDLTFDMGYEVMLSILQDYDPKNRMAVFISSDIMAWGALEAIKSKGLSIPRDIGVIGFDDVFFSKFTNPKLTTFHNPGVMMASLATKLLVEQLSHTEEVFSQITLVPGELVERESL